MIEENPVIHLESKISPRLLFTPSHNAHVQHLPFKIRLSFRLRCPYSMSPPGSCSEAFSMVVRMITRIFLDVSHTCSMPLLGPGGGTNGNAIYRPNRFHESHKSTGFGSNDNLAL